MAKEIKQKIVLDGEKEYSAAIRDANRNLRTLRSELKAETAEMGRNATESEKTRVKTQSLRQQIAEQEKIVAAYRNILAEVREKYADNQDAIAAWEQKLNNARATLGNMRSDLEGVGETFRSLDRDSATAVTATKSVADSIGRISEVGSAVADSIESIFTGMVDTISSAVSEVWAMISETAARANNWSDIAGYWNTDPQKVQQWARAVAASQNEFTDLTNAVSKVAYGDHKKIQELTGVGWAGDIDQWQYAMDVLNSIASMDYTQKANALEELFGEKRASKVMDLLNDWQTIQELLPQFNGNETGYGMSDQELQTMNDLYVEMGRIEEKWQAIKDKVAAGLGVAAMGLSVTVEGMLDGVADFLNAKDEGEREAALQKIRTNLEDFFRRLAAVVQECIGILHSVGEELQNSDDPVTKAIGEILVGLTDALQWMIDHQNEVKTAFEAIFGVWLLAKLAAVGARLLEITKNIETIKTFRNWNAPTNTPTTGTPTTGTPTTGTPATGTPATGTPAAAQNVATQNVTTQNATTQNVTTQNATTLNVTTQNATTGHVQTMYVQNMVGGNNKLPNSGNNGTPGTGTPDTGTPATGTPGTPALPGPSMPAVIPTLPSGTSTLPSSTPTLPSASTPALPSASTPALPSASTPAAPGANNVTLEPNEFSVSGPDSLQPPVRDTTPQQQPNEKKPPSFDPYSLVPLAVIAVATAAADIEQRKNDERWKEEQDLANAVADALEEALGESSDADLIRAAAAAVGPKKKADGSYEMDAVLGRWLNMNPTSQMDYVLQSLGDVKKRGQLYSDIMRYGDPESDNVAGWRPWSALLRYWGEYTDETGRRQNNPLEPYEVDELVTYIRDLYVKKAQEQLEQQKEAQEAPPEDGSDKQPGGGGPTDAQQAAAEAFWDAYREYAMHPDENENEERFDKALENYEQAFADAPELFEKIDGLITSIVQGKQDNSWTGIEDLPAYWWMDADKWQSAPSQENGITGQDLQGFLGLPARLLRAAQEGTAKGVSSIRVYMDGVAVGHLVAPTVSQDIANAIG